MTARTVPVLSRWPLVVVSAVVWVLMWGDLSALIVVSGVVVGLLVALLFPQPPEPYSGRLHPLGFAALVATLLIDLVRGSITVVRRAIGPSKPMRNAIVGVRLRTRSDLFLTLTSLLVSVVPGSSVVEVRRTEGMCYVHVMDVQGPADLERIRAVVLTAEARVVRAFGSVDDLARLAAPAEENR
jgi:multicomponent Na+:H+ antiporter subunit E